MGFLLVLTPAFPSQLSFAGVVIPFFALHWVKASQDGTETTGSGSLLTRPGALGGAGWAAGVSKAFSSFFMLGEDSRLRGLGPFS